MRKFLLGLFICGLCEGVLCFKLMRPVDVPFFKNYVAGWGTDHIKYIGGGSQVQLVLDKRSGAGFNSRDSYLFGFFSMKMKLIAGDSAGVVTTFYLSSKAVTAFNDNHDEIDIEFLGNRSGQPYALQTNIFTTGIGAREERTVLWFDPSKQYHTYSILWSIHAIVFFVDNIPIRIFKNSPDLGVKYPIGQAMKVYTSLWNGEAWATRGGKDKIDWSKAPFVTSYSSFAIDACPAATPQQAKACSTPRGHWWNNKYYQDLDVWQYKILRWVHNHQTSYNYCRNPNIPRARECDRNRD